MIAVACGPKLAGPEMRLLARAVAQINQASRLLTNAAEFGSVNDPLLQSVADRLMGSIADVQLLQDAVAGKTDLPRDIA